jgi:pilus assembly protein Flp/PilA
LRTSGSGRRALSWQIGSRRAKDLDMNRRFKKFLTDCSGATAIEYGLITSLIAVAIIATIINLTSHMNNTFNEVSGNLK